MCTDAQGAPERSASRPMASDPPHRASSTRRAELGGDVERRPLRRDRRRACAIGDGTTHRRALRDRGPHDDRPRQPHLRHARARRRAAGQEVPRRADANS
ncbi:MAG: hypothetical protein MZW92_54720 [Comamonadaceae bacterium]|nr:hypothetical protein [Comamonadaceae bacterium]